jgi:hypothetical protein
MTAPAHCVVHVSEHFAGPGFNKTCHRAAFIQYGFGDKDERNNPMGGTHGGKSVETGRGTVWLSQGWS